MLFRSRSPRTAPRPPKPRARWCRIGFLLRGTKWGAITSPRRKKLDTRVSTCYTEFDRGEPDEIQRVNQATASSRLHGASRGLKPHAMVQPKNRKNIPCRPTPNGRRSARDLKIHSAGRRIKIAFKEAKALWRNMCIQRFLQKNFVRSEERRVGKECGS